jgi:hypothetical protein
MSENDIEREIESVRRREAFFSLLINQPDYYQTRKAEIEAQLVRLQAELDSIYDNENHKSERLSEARETVQTLYDALRKKQLERIEREKEARREAAARKSEESPTKKKKKLTFEQKLAMIPPEKRKLFTDEQWRSFLE